MADNNQLADLYLDNAAPADPANLFDGIDNLLRYVLNRDDGADEAAAEPQPQPQRQQRNPGLAAAFAQFQRFGLANQIAREVAQGADDEDVSDDEQQGDGGPGADTMGRFSTGRLYDWTT